MLGPDVYLAYVVACFVIAIVPGPTVTVIVANSLSYGTRAGLLNVAGTQAGLAVMMATVVVGLSTVIAVMGMWFDWLRLAGAAYLVWLGLRALREAWRGTVAASADRPPRLRKASPFRQGLLSNLLNPKIALVFTTLIPQFVDPGHPAVTQTLLLAAIFIGMGVVWLTSYALLVAKLGAFLRRSLVRRVVSAVTGTVLTALGVRLALERR